MSWAKKKINYQKYEKPSEFLRLRQGDNIIRILSDGFIVKKHEFRTNGKFVSAECQGQGCTMCASGNDYKNKFGWIVLDREMREVKYMQVGITVGDAIAKIGRNQDLTKIDVIITRKGTGKSTSYQVSAKQDSKELVDSEKKIVREAYPYLTRKYLLDPNS